MHKLFIYNEEELLFLRNHTSLDVAQYLHYHAKKKEPIIKEIEYNMRVSNWIINCRKAWRKYLEDESFGYGLEEFARIALENAMKNNIIKLKKR